MFLLVSWTQFHKNVTFWRSPPADEAWQSQLKATVSSLENKISCVERVLSEERVKEGKVEKGKEAGREGQF